MDILSKTKKNGDFWIIILTLGLTIFGVIMVFSSSYYYALSKTGNAYHFLIRDCIYAAAGLIGMLVCSRINYKAYKKIALPLVIISLILLGLVFVPGLGKTVNGATRWIDLKLFTLMPGEIAKPSIILFASAYFAANPKRITKIGSLLFIAIITGAMAVLIMMQPNMSTAATLVLIVCAIMFVAGLSMRWVVFAGVAGIVGGTAYIFHEGGYKLKRVMSFLHPFDDPLGDGYQVVQGLFAMGSGGLIGAGLGKGLQKNLYIPEPHTDFILATIGEELGFVGVAILMFAYLLLIWRLIHVCVNAPDRFSMLLGSGITAMLAIQVIFNIAIVTSSMPPTGVALPFISYGGNSLIIFCSCMGIMLNIAHHSER